MGVVVRDARRLSPEAQEDLRRRAVAAVKGGMTQAAVSTVFGVSAKTVWRWVNAFDGNGNRALKAGRRGRRAGEQKALAPREEARVRRAVLGKYLPAFSGRGPRSKAGPTRCEAQGGVT